MKAFRTSSLASLVQLGIGLAVGVGACASVTTPADDGSGGTPGGATGGTVGGGGTGGRTSGSGGQGGLLMAKPDGGAMCGMENFDLERKPAIVMLVLDRSASMIDNLMDEPPTGPNDPTKWSQVVPALTQTIPLIGGDLSWGMKVFPEGRDPMCTTNTVTTRIDFPVTPMGGQALAAAINAVQPDGNGTPTGPAVTVAVDYLKTLNSDARKYILLATDGQPSCGGRVGALTGGGSSAAAPPAIAAVTAAADAGIHTFVLGVATTKSGDVTTLNALALAGLEPRADPNPLATRFYLASTSTELTRALETITGVVSTCIFPLRNAPPVPENIAVKVSGMKAPQNAADGWDYSNGTMTEVTVRGSWCERIRTEAANKVEIIFGCPDIPIP